MFYQRDSLVCRADAKFSGSIKVKFCKHLVEQFKAGKDSKVFLHHEAL